MRTTAVLALAALLVGSAQAAEGVYSTVAPPVVAALGAETVVAPYAAHVNHAHLAPTFRWGWFGAEHVHPRVQWSRSYNGDLVRWSSGR